MNLTNKAQSGAVFRLMIDGIIGFLILLLILSTLSYFEALSYKSDRAEFFTKVQAAVQSPNGKVIFSEKQLRFAEGNGFSTYDLRNVTGYAHACFEFQSNLFYVDIDKGNIERVNFAQNTAVNVYMRCEPSSRTSSCELLDDTCCEINCVISFGEELENTN